jgi:hypothetical protein
MTEQSLDARRMAQDQQSRIANAIVLGLNAGRPFLQYQPSMLRLMADYFELMAHNYERGIEVFTGAAEQQTHEARQTPPRQAAE